MKETLVKVVPNELVGSFLKGPVRVFPTKHHLDISWKYRVTGIYLLKKVCAYVYLTIEFSYYGAMRKS